MSTTVVVHGAIDRHEPDPQAPGDPLSRWIGGVSVSWNEGGPRQAAAALTKVCTGRGTGDAQWGQYVLQLRWLGDAPPPDIAQMVYDYVLDGGPSTREVNAILESQPRSAAQPSYRVARMRVA